MSRSPILGSAVAALLMLFALSGCGKEATPTDLPESPTPTTAVGATSATSATPSVTATDEPAAKRSAGSKRFAAKLDTICREHDSSEAEVYYADALASGGNPKSDLDDMVASYRRLVRAAAALDPPTTAEADFNAYLGTLRSLVRQSAPLSAALRSGNVDRAVVLDRAFSAALAKRNQAAIKLGAENCIMDSAD